LRAEEAQCLVASELQACHAAERQKQEEDMGTTEPGTTEPAASAFWLDVLRLPARILASGLAALAIALLWRSAIGPAFTEPLAASLDSSWGKLIVGILVFIVGVCVVMFLWWLTARFFNLIALGKIDGAIMAEIKDLPMGLPEGTVRAILALVVAMVGLPLLLFHDLLGLSDAIAGYINGIIAGVFGFYFGTRTSGVPTKAVDKIADAQQTAIQKTDEAAAAKVDAANAQSKVQVVEAKAAAAKNDATDELKRTRDATNFDSNLGKVARHLALADTVLKVFAGALPPGVIPPGTAEILADAQKTLAALRSVTSANATQDQLDQLATLVEVVTGSASPTSALINYAIPLFENVLPIPELGPVASVVAFLGFGAKLGSSQYQRWRTRVLAAPVGQGLVDFGAMTAELMHAALRQAPLISDALAKLPQAEVESVLANAIVSPDAANLLLAAYGPQGSVAPDLLDLRQAQTGLAELRQALLALYSANDVQENTVRQVTDALSNAVHPALASGTVQSALRALSPPDANRLINAFAGISARPDLPEDRRAAFDALVTLVDEARHQNIDLLATLGELRQ
jgi:hypothetical protein